MPRDASLKAFLSEIDVQQWEPLVTLIGFRNVGEAHTADPNLPDPRSLASRLIGAAARELALSARVSPSPFALPPSAALRI